MRQTESSGPPLSADKGKGQISQPLHTVGLRGSFRNLSAKKTEAPLCRGDRIPAWSDFRMQLFRSGTPHHLSDTPTTAQCPPLREIRQVVSWRLHVAQVPPTPQGEMYRCISLYLHHSQCTQTSAENLTYVPSSHLLQAPLALLTSPLKSPHSRVQNVQGSHIGKGVWSFLRSTYNR